ncbi:hypothetical protein BDC45DRAFT_2402 [Circinella umbellata]|nr:hypothetical protein BDC45DRAFT_2402 [Circinella umbellata]
MKMSRFFDRATQDTDDWVQMTAHILQGVPMERKLDMNVETWSDSFGILLNDIGNGVKQNGISFHANEYAVMIDEAREDCIYGTEVYNANKPTLKQHFALKTPPQQTTRAKHRKQALQALVDKERAEMVLPISPTTPGSMNTTTTTAPGVTRSLPISSMNGGPAPKRQAIAPPSQNLFIGRGNPRRPPLSSRPMAPGANSLFNTRPNTRPIPTSAPGAFSMFIPSRKGSLGAARPAPVRPVIPIPSSSSAAPSNNPPTPTTPKGFQKQSRVQMLDFTESNQMLQDNNRKKGEAEQRLKDQQEQLKQENALRRQQQREEAAKWKKTNAKPAKRQRTSSVSTSRESSDPPSSPSQTTTTPPSNPSSPTLSK